MHVASHTYEATVIASTYAHAFMLLLLLLLLLLILTPAVVAGHHD